MRALGIPGKRRLNLYSLFVAVVGSVEFMLMYRAMFRWGGHKSDAHDSRILPALEGKRRFNHDRSNH
jgi:hypothetical protein